MSLKPRPRKTIEHLFKHARRRALTRYGLELSRQEYNAICLAIKTGAKNATFLVRETNSRTHWLINDTYIVVYDKNIGGVSTFLPPDAIHNYLTGSDFFKVRRIIKGWHPEDDD